MNMHPVRGETPVQAGLPHLVASAYAARLRLSDACRAGRDLPDEAEFCRLEGEAIDARHRVRDVIAALGINPDMLAQVLA